MQSTGIFNNCAFPRGTILKRETLKTFKFRLPWEFASYSTKTTDSARERPVSSQRNSPRGVISHKQESFDLKIYQSDI